MSKERRTSFRIPQNRLITEFCGNEPFFSNIANLCSTGIYTVKPFRKNTYEPRLIQLEIPIPEASEAIWATGEIVFEEHSESLTGSGIRFTNMARSHEKILRDLLEEKRQATLKQMLSKILWEKEMYVHNSTYTAPPPPPCEHTVPRFCYPCK
jgi:hypothetical protein